MARNKSKGAKERVEGSQKRFKRYGDGSQRGTLALLPEGQSTAGIHNPTFAAALGEMVSYWPWIEEQMIQVLRSLIGNHEQEIPTQQIFRAIVSQDARITMMRSILEQSPINRNKGAVYDAMISEFESLNRARNKFVHGLWWTHDKSGRMFLQPASTNEFGFLEQREISLNEMHGVIDRMSRLWRRITGVVLLGSIEPPTGPTRP